MEQIHEYFDDLITERIAFLDPLKHDNLLVDDETFSRSKRYFWATSTLKELDAVIPENIQHITELINQRELTPVAGDEVGFVEASRKRMRQFFEQLKEIAERLRDKRQEALDLRDGLFNVSAVVESRAATRLGENAKLLTFVSIFFLPLRFVW
ncbi:putative mg2+ transporter zinc transport protein [Botrytis fragariae]|uniref:Putative mg2+ transporter zinc transport protein n=1 Tax=Botrytis fragariae TaxID=1964551 RepID=A0A8H6ANA3_9HELO|nr:putative mg2+ transporter zinc transport protein [Botrytis fragariae]KAF5870652.1 putative mg2+ transporter zinc transport protein [Botrytis fragariae]